MYENMTVLSNREYADLIIKAHKYEEMEKHDVKELILKASKYDELRKNALECSYISYDDRRIFGITKEEHEAYHKALEEEEE